MSDRAARTSYAATVVRQVPERFRVAFSLAGEDREVVRPLAELVERRLGESSVFYDEWYEHLIAGVDADLELQDIYRHRSDLVVVCVSGHYDKIWTRIEHRAIRTRYQGRTLADRLGVLHLRVGDGEVRGVLDNEIVPETRGRLDEAARLIAERLGLLGGEGSVVDAKEIWATGAEQFEWPIADHRQAREAFGALLRKESDHRLLPIKGPSETGKSSLARLMYRNLVQHLNGLRCGRLDLKGHTERRRALDVLAADLSVGQSAPDDWSYAQSILRDLRSNPLPTVLILDSYENVGDLVRWVETILLEDVARHPWLRVVVLGQEVPEAQHHVWESISAPVIELRFPTASEWFDHAGHVLTARGMARVEALQYLETTVDLSSPTFISQLLEGNR